MQLKTIITVIAVDSLFEGDGSNHTCYICKCYLPNLIKFHMAQHEIIFSEVDLMYEFCHGGNNTAQKVFLAHP